MNEEKLYETIEIQKKIKLKSETTLNTQGKSTTLKTVVPSPVREVLQLKNKNKLIWKINPENKEITVSKK